MVHAERTGAACTTTKAHVAGVGRTNGGPFRSCNLWYDFVSGSRLHGGRTYVHGVRGPYRTRHNLKRNEEPWAIFAVLMGGEEAGITNFGPDQPPKASLRADVATDNDHHGCKTERR